MGFSKEGRTINDTWQQRLSFSLSTWETLLYDKGAFYNDPDEKDMGKFINQIILNSEHFIDNNIAEYKTLSEPYLKTLDEKSKTEFLKSLIKSNFKYEKPSPPYKEKQLYLEYKVKQMLIDSENNIYYDSIKEYLETIINEYTRLPYYERERRYFNLIYNDIVKAIKSHKMIEVTVKGKHHGNHIVKPLLVEIDKATNYNYIICQKETNDSLISFRLQHITDIFVTGRPFKKPAVKIKKALAYHPEQSEL